MTVLKYEVVATSRFNYFFDRETYVGEVMAWNYDREKMEDWAMTLNTRYGDNAVEVRTVFVRGFKK